MPLNLRLLLSWFDAIDKAHPWLFDSVLLIMTAAISIIALWQTRRQIKLSNKQHLFDKRLDAFMVLDGLVELYKNNKKFFSEEKKDEPMLAIDLDFVWLTNNVYLEQVSGVINKPLKQPNYRVSLAKLEDMKAVSKRMGLIFNGRAALAAGNFVLRYKELLFAIYQYQILLNLAADYAKKQPKKTLEKALQAFKEPSRRAELQEAIKRLSETFGLLEKRNILKTLERQISLTSWRRKVKK